MTTMTLVPKRWYSWDFAVQSGDRMLADLDLSSWREKGVITIDGVEHRVYREGAMSGDFVIYARGRTLARATKASAFTHTVIISYNGRDYSLQKQSVWRRAFVLMDGEKTIGSIAPKSAWTRAATVELPPDWPLPIRAFVIWLALILWKRDADGGAGG